MIRCVVRNAVAIRRRQKFILVLYMSLIFLSFLWMRKDENSTHQSAFQKPSVRGDNRGKNIVSDNVQVGGNDSAKLVFQIETIFGGPPGTYKTLLNDKEEKKTSSAMIDDSMRMSTVEWGKENTLKTQKTDAQTKDYSNVKTYSSAINTRISFLPSKTRTPQALEYENFRHKQNNFRNHLRNEAPKISGSKYKTGKVLKTLQSQLSLTSAKGNGKIKSLHMASGARTQKPFPDDNIQLARRQFTTSSSDLEHSVSPETNLIMDNISRTDIASFLGNPEKVVAITENTGAVMKKLVTLPKFPHGSVSRPRHTDASHRARLSIKSQDHASSDEKGEHIRQFSKSNIRDEKVRSYIAAGRNRLNALLSPRIPEQKRDLVGKMEVTNSKEELFERKKNFTFSDSNKQADPDVKWSSNPMKKKRFLLIKSKTHKTAKENLTDQRSEESLQQVKSMMKRPIKFRKIISKENNKKYIFEDDQYLLELYDFDVKRIESPNSKKPNIKSLEKHNSKTPSPEKPVEISNSKIQPVEVTQPQSGTISMEPDAELVPVEILDADYNSPIVVHEPDRQAQVAAEALSTLPPSLCCLQDWHVLPHNQKLEENYLRGRAQADQVRDYDETKSYSPDPEGRSSEKITLNDTFPRGNDVGAEKNFRAPRNKVFVSTNENKSRSDIEDSVSQQWPPSTLSPPPPGLSILEEALTTQDAYTNDPNKVGGGRWINEVWVPNTDLPSTSAFYFTTMSSYSPKPARPDPPIKIEEITARRKFPSRPNYFLRKLATGSRHKRKEAERSWRGFILSGSRREQEDEFQTERSPQMMKKEAKFPHQSERRMMNRSSEMFHENEVKPIPKEKIVQEFPMYDQSGKSNTSITPERMKRLNFGATKESIEKRISGKKNSQYAEVNNSVNFLRRSASPNRRKLSSNSNSTLLVTPSKLVASKHLSFKKSLTRDRSTNTSRSFLTQLPTIDGKNDYNGTDEEEIVAINYEDFQVKEVPLPFQTELRYRIAFKKRLLLQWDYSRPAFFPWRGIPDYCSNYPVRFLKPGSMPPLLLVSFPGSGNTWLRFLTEALTGTFTGSFYADPALRSLGMWGEAETPGGGTTILQKTHSLPQSLYGATSKFLPAYQVDPRVPLRVVLLIRSPLDALVALRHYHAAGHTGFGQQWYFRGRDWAAFTSEKAAAWYKLYEAWLQWRTSDILVMHYEEIKEDPQKEALRLLKFLGAPLDRGRLQCTLRHPEGKFKRPSYPKHMQGYSVPKNVSEYLSEAQWKLNQILAKKNLPLIPLHLQRFFPSVIDTATAFEIE